MKTWFEHMHHVAIIHENHQLVIRIIIYMKYGWTLCLFVLYILHIESISITYLFCIYIVIYN